MGPQVQAAFLDVLARGEVIASRHGWRWSDTIGGALASTVAESTQFLDDLVRDRVRRPVILLARWPDLYSPEAVTPTLIHARRMNQW